MSTTGPEATSTRLVECLNAGDLDALMDLYEPQAVFADLDGVVAGLGNIRSAHKTFLASGLSLALTDFTALEADDIALVHWAWTVRDPDGETMSGVSAEVLRRQPDGTWKFIIDNSDGSALVGIH